MEWENGDHDYDDGFINVVFVDRDRTDYSSYFDLREMPNPREQKVAHVIWSSKQSFNEKLKKWEGTLKTDLQKKSGMSQSEIQSWLTGNLYKTIISKYIFPLFCLQYYYCISDGVSNYFVKFDKAIITKQLEKLGAEGFNFMTSNIPAILFKTTVGPIMKAFMEDGYYEGLGYCARDAFDAVSGKDNNW